MKRDASLPEAARATDLPCERRTDTVWTLLSESPLPEAEAGRFLHDADAGGIATFVGTTRRWTHGRETRFLEYEAYADMVMSEFDRLALAAGRRWPSLRTVVMHRVGRVDPGDASVLVGVSTPHRDAAFEACRWLIDELKREAPIWKRETYADGTAEWVEPKND